MGSFGERMRREREKRGISLDSISETTKIGTHILEALEKEKFDRLPGGIFNKEFVRSYARCLGMNEEQVLKEFIDVAGDRELPLPDPAIPRRLQLQPQPKDRLSWGGVAAAVVCAAALLVAGWKVAPVVLRAAGGRWSRGDGNGSQPAMDATDSPATNNGSSGSSQRDEPSSSVPGTNQPENVAPATLQPASATTTAPAQPVPEASPARAQKFVILIKARKPTWVSITADGKPVLEGLLKRKKRIHAYSQIVLKTDNAGALAVARNGRPLPRLGVENHQATVTFTPDAVRR